MSEAKQSFLYETSHLNVQIKELRYYIVGKITHKFGFCVHAMWVFTFYFLEAYTLSFINIFSALTFLLTYKLNKWGGLRS